MTNGLIAPHGGALVINMADESERVILQERARTLPQLEVGSRQLADLEMLAIGAYSPLRGFMTRADYPGVCERYAPCERLTLVSAHYPCCEVRTGSLTQRRHPGCPGHCSGNPASRDDD